jgi:putative transcriptional regulator
MNDEMFNELADSVREGMAIMKGKKQPSRIYHFESSNIQKIRSRYNLSQQDFARMIGISVDTLQNWEQGRRKPSGPAKVLLEIAQSNPEVLLKTFKPAVKED